MKMETHEEAKERIRKEYDIEWLKVVVFGIYPEDDSKIEQSNPPEPSE